MIQIIKPSGFPSVLKGRYLLLDTNVFIDALIHPKEFTQLFNELKANNVVLVTLKVVLAEFIKGANDEKKFQEKRETVENIIDAYLPIREEICDEAIDLITKYKEEGKAVSITDYILGAYLKKYSGSVYLLTKNISDFPCNIFTLQTYFNIFHRRAIHNYGVYGYNK